MYIYIWYMLTTVFHADDGLYILNRQCIFICKKFACRYDPGGMETVVLLGFLPQRSRCKIAAISQSTIKNVFSWMKMCEVRSKFHRSLFLRVQLKYSSIRSDNDLAPYTNYLNPCWSSSPTHICGTRRRWVNSMGVMYHACLVHVAQMWFHTVSCHENDCIKASNNEWKEKGIYWRRVPCADSDRCW